MNNKEQYYQALLENKGQLNETDLGERLGLDEEETRHIITQLLMEHRIEYAEQNACNYRILKSIKGRKKAGGMNNIQGGAKH